MKEKMLAGLDRDKMAAKVRRWHLKLKSLGLFWQGGSMQLQQTTHEIAKLMVISAQHTTYCCAAAIVPNASMLASSGWVVCRAQTCVDRH